MERIKQLTLFLLLIVGFSSCKVEEVDELLKDETKNGEAIFRFDMNGQTRVARGKNVKVEYAKSNQGVIYCTISDMYNNYNPQVFAFTLTNMSGTSFEKGTYTTHLSPKIAEAFFLKEANNWVYSTDIEGPAGAVTNRGEMEIKTIKDDTSEIEGTFNFTLYPQDGDKQKTPIEVKNGYFKYIKL